MLQGVPPPAELGVHRRQAFPGHRFEIPVRPTGQNPPGGVEESAGLWMIAGHQGLPSLEDLDLGSEEGVTRGGGQGLRPSQLLARLGVSAAGAEQVLEVQARVRLTGAFSCLLQAFGCGPQQSLGHQPLAESHPGESQGQLGAKPRPGPCRERLQGSKSFGPVPGAEGQSLKPRVRKERVRGPSHLAEAVLDAVVVEA